MDPNGYPDEQELACITNWTGTYAELMAYIEPRWKYSDCGFWHQTGDQFEISTGGWSGNEDIIQALAKNTMFWILCWVSSRRGGHYEFEIKHGNPNAAALRNPKTA